MPSSTLVEKLWLDPCSCRVAKSKKDRLTSLPLRRGYADIDVVSDIASMPLPDNSFEVVICTDVLEHVLNPWQAVLEIGRLLKSHGCMGVAAAD